MKSSPENTVSRQHGAKKERGGPKLPALPKGSKILKRPLAHRIGAAPSRTVYVSSKAPFMSLVKRVRKKMDQDSGGSRLSSTRGLPLLAQIDNLHVRTSAPKGAPAAAEPGASSSATAGPAAADNIPNEKHEVKVLATGKAIEKALEVAAWFSRQPDCIVAIRTGSINAVDEVEFPRGRTLASAETERDRVGDKNAHGDVEMDSEPEEFNNNNNDNELDSYRMRMLTYVEVGVKYRTS